MPAPYTCPVLSYTTKTNKVDLVDASHINAVQTEIAAINNRLLNTIDSDGSILSGSAFPSPALPSQLFYRTDLEILYIRNSSNSAWPAVSAISNIQVFTSSGTFTAPTGITKVYLTATGSGGGGAGSSSGSAGGGGGGAGECVINYPYTVVPGNNYTVTINSAGTGGGTASNGTNGGSTVFDTITLAGGTGGIFSGAGGSGYSPDASGSSAGSIGVKTGTGGARAGTSGGGGGSSPLGKGGNATSTTGDNATGYGSGGGGAGATGNNGGGNGSPGIVIISY